MRRLAALAALLALTGCGGDELHGDLLLRADRVFDGERILNGGEVLVADGEIVAVGDVDGDADRVIDLGDATILPGVIDLHVHRSADPAVREQMVRGGVTTVRDLGAPLGTLSRRAAAATRPRRLAAGPIVTAPGGYPVPVWGADIAYEVRGRRAAGAAVRDLARRGASVIKVSHDVNGGGPLLDVDEIRATVDEAHDAGLQVTLHSHGAAVPLEAGVDELSHIVCGPFSDDIWRALVRAEIEIVATLHVMSFCADAVANAKRFAELGGTLLYGSDYGVPGIPVGIDVTELRLLRDAGLSAEDALAAATSRAGKQLGLEPLGTLAPGAPADVIAVRGDARAVRDDLARPLLVVFDGRIVHESLR